MPEGYTRRTVAGWLRVDEGDYLSILKELGKECIGAIKITDTFTQGGISSEYIELTDEQLKELATEGTQISTKFITRSRISLAGASGKTGLYYDEENDKWYMPFGDAPSTHIVKQSHVRLSSVVANEQLCMMTAMNLGLDTPKSFIINTGNGNDEDVLFATKRYDRLIANDGKKICGMTVPKRLHQEDFGQALKIRASQKYETHGENYLKKMFELLRAYSSNPIEDSFKLWDMVVFNYLVGNTDAHVKNFALIYNENLTKIRLAPIYDVLSTVIYKESTKNMAFSIGGKYDIANIKRDDFEAEASKCGLGAGMAMKHFDDLKIRFKETLEKSAKELTKQGFTKAMEIHREILT